MGVATMYSPAARLAGALRPVKTGWPCHFKLLLLLLLLLLLFSVLCAVTVLLPLSAISVPVLAAAEYGELCTADSLQPFLRGEACRVTVKGLAEQALNDTIAR